MGPVEAWDRLESLPQKGKKKHIFNIVALLYELKEKPGFKHRAGGFQNLSFFHSARCLLVPRTCPWLPGIHPACHLPFTLQNFLTHAHPPDESVVIRISLLMPCLSAPLRTCSCSAVHGLILAVIHVALSDPDWSRRSYPWREILPGPFPSFLSNKYQLCLYSDQCCHIACVTAKHLGEKGDIHLGFVYEERNI